MPTIELVPYALIQTIADLLDVIEVGHPPAKLIHVEGNDRELVAVAVFFRNKVHSERLSAAGKLEAVKFNSCPTVKLKNWFSVERLMVIQFTDPVVIVWYDVFGNT